jgi:hypothetical protein
MKILIKTIAIIFTTLTVSCDGGSSSNSEDVDAINVSYTEDESGCLVTNISDTEINIQEADSYAKILSLGCAYADDAQWLDARRIDMLFKSDDNICYKYEDRTIDYDTCEPELTVPDAPVISAQLENVTIGTGDLEKGYQWQLEMGINNTGNVAFLGSYVINTYSPIDSNYVDGSPISVIVGKKISTLASGYNSNGYPSGTYDLYIFLYDWTGSLVDSASGFYTIP